MTDGGILLNLNKSMCVMSDLHLCSSEPSLGSCHELQNQQAGTVPDPLLFARSDGFDKQRVCGPVHPALHQPDERWATLVQEWEGGGGWSKSHQVINGIRWHCVMVFSVSTLSAFLKVVSAPSHLYSTQAFGSYIYISFPSSHRLPLGTPLVTRRMQPRSSLPLRLCVVYLKTALCLRHTHTNPTINTTSKEAADEQKRNISKSNIEHPQIQIPDILSESRRAFFLLLAHSAAEGEPKRFQRGWLHSPLKKSLMHDIDFLSLN